MEINIFQRYPICSPPYPEGIYVVFVRCYIHITSHRPIENTDRIAPIEPLFASDTNHAVLESSTCSKPVSDPNITNLITYGYLYIYNANKQAVCLQLALTEM